MNEEVLVTNYSKSRFDLTLNTLKYIAIIAMAIDHIAHVFVPYESVLGIFMNIIGMIAGPIMFYSVVEGYHHSRSLNKYLLRLGVFAIISQLPFIYFVNGGFAASLDIQSYFYINIIYTMLLGTFAIHIRRKLKKPIIAIILILFLSILCIPTDWGMLGIIFIIIFDYFYGNFKKQALAYCMIVLLLIISNTGIHIALFTFFDEGIFNVSDLNISGIDQAGMFLPIILLGFYNGKKGKGGIFAKWFFYIFYPLHFLVLSLFWTIL